MLDYQMSYEIIVQFYVDNVKFWKSQGKGSIEAYQLALKDVEFITSDPYEPCGKLLNTQAMRDFIQGIAPINNMKA